jgi:hypothetical protein
MGGTKFNTLLGGAKLLGLAQVVEDSVEEILIVVDHGRRLPR